MNKKIYGAMSCTTIKTLMMTFFIIILYFNNGIQGMETSVDNIRGIDSEAKLQKEDTMPSVSLDITAKRFSAKHIYESVEKMEVGDTVSFSCKINGFTQPSDKDLVKLMKKDKMIEVWHARFGELKTEIKIFKIINNGDYKCVYVNKDDITISESATVKCGAENKYSMLNRPEIKYKTDVLPMRDYYVGEDLYSWDKIAVYGELINIQCICVKPEATVLWYKNNEKLDGENNQLLTINASENTSYACQEYVEGDKEYSIKSNGINITVISTEDLNPNDIDLDGKFDSGAAKVMVPLQDKEKILLTLQSNIIAYHTAFKALQDEYNVLKMLQTNTALDVPLLENDASCPKFYSLPAKENWKKFMSLNRITTYLEQDDKLYFAGMFQKKIEGVFVHLGNDNTSKMSNEFIKSKLQNVEFDFECKDFKKNLKESFNELAKQYIPDLQFFIRKDGKITVIDPLTTKLKKMSQHNYITSLWRAIYEEDVIISHRKL